MSPDESMMIATVEDFELILQRGKDHILGMGRTRYGNQQVRDDEIMLTQKLFLASRIGCSFVQRKLINESKLQEMFMVLICIQFDTLCDVGTILMSIEASFAVRENTFLELYLPPDQPVDSSILHHSGAGIFHLSNFLKQVSSSRPAQDGSQKGWQVPLVYILCRIVFDAFKMQPFPTSLQWMLRKIDEICGKIPELVPCKRVAIGLFLFDLLMANRHDRLEGLTVDSVVKHLILDCCYCLKTAASSCSFPCSLDNFRSICVDRLLNYDSSTSDQVIEACNNLFNGFSPHVYLENLRHKSLEVLESSDDATLCGRLQNPSHVFYTYMVLLLIKDDAIGAVSLAAEVEKRGTFSLKEQISFYEQVIKYHRDEGSLFYRPSSELGDVDWIQNSHAVAYVPLAGPLGIQVLVNYLHTLVEDYPEPQFTREERNYISFCSCQTILWVLRLKYGAQRGTQKFTIGKYWNATPVLSARELEVWAQNFLKDTIATPSSIRTIDGSSQPDLVGLLSRSTWEPMAINTEGLASSSSASDRKGVEVLLDLNDPNEDDVVEVIDTESYMQVEEPEGKETTIRDYHVENIANDEATNARAEDDALVEETKDNNADNESKSVARLESSRGPMPFAASTGGSVASVAAEEELEDEASQVEKGYDAEESQAEEEEHGLFSPVSKHESDSNVQEQSSQSILSKKRSIDETFEMIVEAQEALPVPPAHPLVDLGYEAEDSQEQSEIEPTLIRKHKRPRLEQGYEAEESQGHSEDEEEELPTEEEDIGSPQQQPLQNASSTPERETRDQPTRLLNPTLSDMSAADERTMSLDDDMIESSELEDVEGQEDAQHTHIQQIPASTVGRHSSMSLLEQYAMSAARMGDESEGAGMPSQGSDASVLDSPSREAEKETILQSDSRRSHENMHAEAAGELEEGDADLDHASLGNSQEAPVGDGELTEKHRADEVAAAQVCDETELTTVASATTLEGRDTARGDIKTEKAEDATPSNMESSVAEGEPPAEGDGTPDETSQTLTNASATTLEGRDTARDDVKDEKAEDATPSNVESSVAAGETLAEGDGTPDEVSQTLTNASAQTLEGKDTARDDIKDEKAEDATPSNMESSVAEGEPLAEGDGTPDEASQVFSNKDDEVGDRHESDACATRTDKGNEAGIAQVDTGDIGPMCLADDREEKGEGLPGTNDSETERTDYRQSFESHSTVEGKHVAIPDTPTPRQSVSPMASVGTSPPYQHLRSPRRESKIVFEDDISDENERLPAILEDGSDSDEEARSSADDHKSKTPDKFTRQEKQVEEGEAKKLRSSTRRPTRSRTSARSSASAADTSTTRRKSKRGVVEENKESAEEKTPRATRKSARKKGSKAEGVSGATREEEVSIQSDTGQSKKKKATGRAPKIPPSSNSVRSTRSASAASGPSKASEGNQSEMFLDRSQKQTGTGDTATPNLRRSSRNKSSLTETGQAKKKATDEDDSSKPSSVRPTRRKNKATEPKAESMSKSTPARSSRRSQGSSVRAKDVKEADEDEDDATAGVSVRSTRSRQKTKTPAKLPARKKDAESVENDNEASTSTTTRPTRQSARKVASTAGSRRSDDSSGVASSRSKKPTTATRKSTRVRKADDSSSVATRSSKRLKK